MSSSQRRTETAVPERNFTLTTEDRVRAAAAGPPAYMRRLRTIEDLEEGIVRVLVELCEESRAEGATAQAQAAHARAAAPRHALRRLDDSDHAPQPLVPHRGEPADAAALGRADRSHRRAVEADAGPFARRAARSRAVANRRDHRLALTAVS